jgi:hypothetical protein
MKRTLCTTLALGLLTLSVPAHASPISISLVNPNQTGSVGQTLQFFGVITNNTNSTVNLVGDDLTLNAPGISLSDLPYNTNAPFFLTADGTAGASSGIIELFDVTLSAGFSGSNLGSFDITGDAGTAIGSTMFSVAPTPEPASFFLLLTSLPAAILPLRNRLRR